MMSWEGRLENEGGNLVSYQPPLSYNVLTFLAKNEVFAILLRQKKSNYHVWKNEKSIIK